MQIEAKSLINALERISKNLEDNVEELVKESASFVSTDLKGRFKKEKDPKDKPWARLTPRTIEDKDADGFGGKAILVRTGDLRDSIQPRKKSKHVYEVTSMRINGRDSKAVWVHQFGSNNAGRGRNTRIPARPFLGITKDSTKGIKGLVEKYLYKTVNK